MVVQWLFSPFNATSFFQYPLKYPPEVFWCFQSVLKETKGMEWVNEFVAAKLTTIIKDSNGIFL